MASVISSKYQIVIPKQIRESLKIRPGQRFEFVQTSNGLFLVRVMTADEAFGSLRGTPNDFCRDREWAAR
jgi:AbrB family looped-hinge helix DNA binding protein